MDNVGALVGWDHQDSGDHILLRLESAESSASLAMKDLNFSRLVMTKQQALVLGHYLMKVSGATIQPARSSWLSKLRKRKRSA